MDSVQKSQTVALVGICVIFGVSLLVTVVFLALYARQRLKRYSNVRRRIIAIARPIVTEEVPMIVHETVLPEPSPIPVIDYPEPAPVPPPAPQKVVVLQPPPPPPPQPQPPPPASEPKVVVHEVIHRYEPAPAPAPPPPPSQQRYVRRRLSCDCSRELDDDWVFVKRVSKNQRNKTKKSNYESSEEDSSDDEYQSKAKRRQKKRLDRYDLATNFIPIAIQQPAQPQPQLMTSAAGFVVAQPAAAAAATAPAMVPVTMLAPNTMVAQQTSMPMFTFTR